MKMQWMALCAAMCVSSAFAEIALSPGGALGVNFPDQFLDDSTGNSLSDVEARTAFIGHAFLEIGLTQSFAVVPAVGLAMRGSERNRSGIDETFRINYLTFPVWFKFKYFMGRIMPFFAAGPDVAFRLTAKKQTQNTSSGLVSSVTEDIKDQTKPIDVGVDILGGADYDAGFLVPFLHAGYYVGFLNSLDSPTGESSQRNIGLFVEAGVRFNLSLR